MRGKLGSHDLYPQGQQLDEPAAPLGAVSPNPAPKQQTGFGCMPLKEGA